MTGSVSYKQCSRKLQSASCIWTELLLWHPG